MKSVISVSVDDPMIVGVESGHVGTGRPATRVVIAVPQSVHLHLVLSGCNGRECENERTGSRENFPDCINPPERWTGKSEGSPETHIGLYPLLKRVNT